jgi:hypothetical protein
MQEQITGLVRSVFTAISRINYEALDSALAEAETAGVLQQLLTAEDHRGLSALHAAAARCNSQLLEAVLAVGGAFGGSASRQTYSICDGSGRQPFTSYEGAAEHWNSSQYSRHDKVIRVAVRKGHVEVLSIVAERCMVASSAVAEYMQADAAAAAAARTACG